MKLKDMYGNYIAGKGPVINVDIPSQISFTKERDPKTIALENAVNVQMNKAIEAVQPKEQKKLPQAPNKIKIVSYEEAIRELSNTLKSTDNKA